ncbi:type II and III secretion system protein family protein [Sphingomonas sp. CGMCC 1.13654]|uniref:Type II and III secretion system protein family protein n=1 Tax=Sphingomonas chungangi TaxID=2683589 RepID=A0A838L8I2_9SPHN|nr:type II and III secretion system protein family protein [Sphingomonas chungangi]MBA2935052.1 type II and III secretion system protein family protein [Sphingomonas chungangi]MVW54168.1 secretion system protein [Sphingomonas chungangi]
MSMLKITRHGAAGSALAAVLALGLAAIPAVPASAKWHPAPKRARLTRVSAPVAAPLTGQVITLSTGRGQLIMLPRPMSDLFVADPNIADVQVRSPTRLYVFGKGAGETTLSATSKDGAVVFAATIRVGTNIGNVQQMLKVAMPEAQIVATPMNGVVVLTGTVQAPDDIEEASRLVQAFVGKDIQVVSRLKTATPLQVMLKVRFSEVNRDLSKNIGFNILTRDTSGSGFLFGASQGNAGTISTVPGTPTPGGPVDSNGAHIGDTLYNLAAAASGTTRFGFMGHMLGLDILTALDLAETDGYATTLAQPTLTALSGETASFLAGGEIPIPVPQFQGVTTIEYKQYGVSLAFTPTVLGDGRISLRVRPEVSQLTSSTVSIQGYQIPGLTTRRAETTVELGSGQSFVIGGLLNNNTSNSVNKAPFLGDLPILGQLFRSNGWKRSESELVIVVTPYLVKPVSDSKIALPTDGYRMGTDAQEVLLDQHSDSTPAKKRAKPVATPPVTQPAVGPGFSGN